MQYFDYHFRVSMHHVDHAGVLFFANLLILAHDAWEVFMCSKGVDLAQLIADGEWHLPIVHTEAEYMQPMRHGDEVDIRLQIEHLGRSSIRVKYTFVDQSGGQLAIARTTHVFIDSDTRHSSEIPAELRIRLQEYATS